MKGPHPKRALRERHRRADAGSRTQVLELLRRGPGTVRDFARSLGLTDNAVRFHLISLQQSGLARPAGMQPGKRRPHVLFELTERANRRFPNLYKNSLDQLLAELKERCSARTISTILRHAGDRLAKLATTPSRDWSAAARARQAAKLLVAAGGSITLERENGTFLLRGRTCPLGEVVAHHPEVCNLVENFLTRATGAVVGQRCEHGPKPQCRFQVHDRPANP